jgi:hypothetical protein
MSASCVHIGAVTSLKRELFAVVVQFDRSTVHEDELLPGVGGLMLDEIGALFPTVTFVSLASGPIGVIEWDQP